MLQLCKPLCLLLSTTVLSNTVFAIPHAIPQGTATTHNVPDIALHISESDLAAQSQIHNPSLPNINDLIAPAPTRVLSPKGSRNGKWGDPVDKYFHETTFNPHYDGRYAVEEVPYRMRRHVLSNMARAYFMTMRDMGVETWIMHGSLLGWWWNKRILPWDSDLDVMVSEQGINMLAAKHHLSTHVFHDEDTGETTEYLLEINPNFVNPDTSDNHNWIDGRWVDTESGLYIDITTLHYADDRNFVRSKDNHTYPYASVYPLQRDEFEGMPCLVPSGFQDLLSEEYGEKALINQVHAKHRFEEAVMDWIPLPPAPPQAVNVQIMTHG